MEYTEAQVRIGSIVIVRGDFGGGAPQQVTVTDVDEKNGRPLIDYQDARGQERWAYLSQIDRVIRY